tara:strand:+ start:231 stop:800 length:570 start_codon:yes stop_codon:yes gene_type:complete
MGLGNVFVRSIVREIGRNYGKAASNSLLGDKHSTPIRVVGHLGANTGGRNYKNQLEKICKTWQVKGSTATFNVAQNMYKSFFDLVEESQSDGIIDVNEILDLMTNFTMMRPQLKKVEAALEQLDKKDLAEKVNELDNSLFDFFVELNNGLVLPPKPKGIFKSKKKKTWELHRSVKENLQDWVVAYNSSK